MNKQLNIFVECLTCIKKTKVVNIPEAIDISITLDVL